MEWQHPQQRLAHASARATRDLLLENGPRPRPDLSWRAGVPGWLGGKGHDAHLSSRLAWVSLSLSLSLSLLCLSILFVLSGVKVRFCESLGCGRDTAGHLLMGGSVFRQKSSFQYFCDFACPFLSSSPFHHSLFVTSPFSFLHRNLP